VTCFVLDMLGILLGIVIFGKKFAGASLLASVAFAAFYGLYGYFPPLLPDLSQVPITAAVLGGLFVGLGEGLLLKAGAASG